MRFYKLLVNILLIGFTLLISFNGLSQENHLYPMKQNFKWGYINKQGEWVIQPKYLRVSEFHQGVAAVANDSYTWQLINKEGKHGKLHF